MAILQCGHSKSFMISDTLDLVFELRLAGISEWTVD